MYEFLSKMIGKKLDVYCVGGSSLSGEAMRLDGPVLQLRDSDQKICYVAVDKIVVVWEARDDEHRAGFVPGQANNR